MGNYRPGVMEDDEQEMEFREECANYSHFNGGDFYIRGDEYHIHLSPPAKQGELFNKGSLQEGLLELVSYLSQTSEEDVFRVLAEQPSVYMPELIMHWAQRIVFPDGKSYLYHNSVTGDITIQSRNNEIIKRWNEMERESLETLGQMFLAYVTPFNGYH